MHRSLSGKNQYHKIHYSYMIELRVVVVRGHDIKSPELDEEAAHDIDQKFSLQDASDGPEDAVGLPLFPLRLAAVILRTLFFDGLLLSTQNTQLLLQPGFVETGLPAGRIAPALRDLVAELRVDVPKLLLGENMAVRIILATFVSISGRFAYIV